MMRHSSCDVTSRDKSGSHCSCFLMMTFLFHAGIASNLAFLSISSLASELPSSLPIAYHRDARKQMKKEGSDQISVEPYTCSLIPRPSPSFSSLTAWKKAADFCLRLGEAGNEANIHACIMLGVMRYASHSKPESH